MTNLPISIDVKGNLQCPDIPGSLQEQIKWIPDVNTISSIQSIVTSVGSFNPAPSSGNAWTGTIANDGQMPGGGDGVTYTIVVNARTGGQKQKSPKITIRPPQEKATESSRATNTSVKAK